MTKKDRSAYHREWRERNPDKVKGYKEKRKEADKKWRQENSDKMAKHAKNHYEKNKDTINAKTVERRKKPGSREKYNAYMRNYMKKKREQEKVA